jgi:tripartite-type tricarboxylate transporter receptor subunit TctC
MKLPRRTFLHLAAGAAALPALSHFAWAQTYPTRPARIVCGYPPGGVVDIYARLIAQWLSERLGQQFIVENKPGAGGTIAAESVVRAAPDGYTLLLLTSADAWNTTLYDNLRFNFARDIAAVAPMSRGPGVLVVHPSVSSKSVPELIAHAKSNPNKIAVASARHRQRTSHVLGTVPERDRRRNAACALSWRRTGAHRPPRRTGPDVLRH